MMDIGNMNDEFGRIAMIMDSLNGGKIACSNTEKIGEAFRSVIPFSKRTSHTKKMDIKPLMTRCTRFDVEWDYENGKITATIQCERGNSDDNGTQRDTDDKVSSFEQEPEQN